MWTIPLTILVLLSYNFVKASTDTLTEPTVSSVENSNWIRSRIVAVGDLHGDFDNAVKVLQLVKVIDEDLKWAGGDYTTFVQTGDVVDRGHDTIKLYELLKRLIGEAEQAGGMVVNLLGNHELMNMMEDYRFVSSQDISSFGDLTKRKSAFSKDGWVGKYLRTLNLTAIVEDTVFCHGGIPPLWASKGIEHMNRRTKQELIEKTNVELYGVDIFGDNGPAWYRGYAMEEETKICSVVDEALALLKVKRMVIGHTVQDDGKINTRCRGKVIIIDVGISSVYGGHLAALELTPTSATAHYPDKTVSLELPPGYLGNPTKLETNLENFDEL